MSAYRLPVALAFDGKGGFKPGRGTAGWTVYDFATEKEMLDWMHRHGEAALPAWKRIKKDPAVARVPGLRRNPTKKAPMTRYSKPTAKQKKFIGHKIPILVEEGYPQKQAIAIAYSMSGAKRRGVRANPSGPVSAEARDFLENYQGREADELVLYATNDYDLYRQMMDPIQKNLARKIKSGKYDRALAVKAWMYLVDVAAKKYAKEFASAGDWSRMFPPAVRKEAAKDLRDSFEAEVKAGGVEQFLK